MLVLCFPLAAVGHLNASLGLAFALRNRGHDVVFANEINYAGHFEKIGFKEELYVEFDKEQVSSWEETTEALFPIIRKPPTEQLEFFKVVFQRGLDGIKKSDDQIRAIIQKVKPDIIVQDACLPSAATNICGIPVVAQCPLNPLWALTHENLPPPYTCYSFLKPDKEKWQAFLQTRHKYLQPLITEYNKWLMSKGATPVEATNFRHVSPYLNLLTYPKALTAHYLKFRDLETNFLCVDHSIRPCKDTFEIPQKLQNLPGKLILLSMGSIGSADVNLMKILVEILGQTNHRYIVSAGCYHDRYELADNMWGASFLPQLAVLKVVDLFITHGGNNSFVESLYYGKPMVVLPLFVDQFDNAAMAEDGQVGTKFMPFQEPRNNLIEKINMVLNSDEILTNVQTISKSMQNSQSLDEAVKRIEAIVDQNKNKCAGQEGPVKARPRLSP